jgi:hypothetical protein
MYNKQKRKYFTKSSIFLLYKGENYRPFDELKELKDVLYDEENRILPINAKQSIMSRKKS